jgi:hypothetical protein
VREVQADVTCPSDHLESALLYGVVVTNKKKKKKKTPELSQFASSQFYHPTLFISPTNSTYNALYPNFQATSNSLYKMASSDNHRIQVALNRAIELGEIGISLAVYHRGKLIIDAMGKR